VRRIQGTDGIRRRTLQDGDSEVRGLVPLEAFLRAGVITPRFMELYGYCFIADLVRIDRFQPGDQVVVGWDPRDPSGDFVEAFMRGIRKHGATVLSVGILPTPAVPAYVLHVGAAAGAMITASHNLKDQNGVKLFWGNQGLKYLPADDERLTAVIFELERSLDLKTLPISGQIEDHHDAASSLFESLMLNAANSWIRPDDDSASRLGFDKIELVVDTANGCLSEFAAKLFRKLGFTNVHEVNTSLEGNVNEGGGVAALEGAEIITREDVFAGEGSGASPFSEHKAVLEMFRLADELKDALISGDRLLVAAVFDADGDRFFRLDYVPNEDALIVSSGDEAAFLQAKYLVETLSVSGRPKIVHTVESDINMGNFASESLGVCSVMTAVGDKWVLYEAFASLIECRVSHLARLFADRGQSSALEALKAASDALDRLLRQRSSSSQDYFDLQAQVLAIQRKHCCPDETAALENDLLRPGAISYLIGFEETGHSITPAILEVANRQPPAESLRSHNFLYQRTQTGRLARSELASNCQPPTANWQPATANQLFFAGNGLKAAINTFVATQTMLQSKDVAEFHRMMAAPFPRGFKRTYYAYYTRKEEFVFGAKYWQELAEWLEDECVGRFGQRYDVKRVEFAEDRDMIFISLRPKGRSTTAASIFVRNSGTEEKTGVNVRGPRDLSDELDAAGDLARRRLQRTLKSGRSDYAAAEALLLAKMVKREARGEVLTVGDAAQRLADKYPNVVAERLLLEMFKQDFITLESLSQPKSALHLSDLGRWFIGQVSL